MATKEAKQVERALAPREEKAVIVWQGRNITITFDDVKKRICPKADDQEVVVFLKTCHSLNLNPWERDIFMVKYKDDEPASYIVASQAYQKAAENCPEFDGYEAGIFIEADGELKQREGAFLLDREQNKLVGGWAKVYRKDRQRPFYTSVNIKECAKYTREGKMTRFWSSMPATMIRKVALARSLREAFPSRLGGMVTDAEYDEIPEVELPPAFEKPNGEKNWKHFWAKVKTELGLTTEQARALLQVESIKDELIDAGWTMERIWNELISALQQQKDTETKTEQVVDVQTGEIITQDEDLEKELFGEREEDAGVAAPVEAETKQPSGTAAPAKLKRDPASIKTLNDLMRACFHDFKMQPAAVVKELGHKSQSEINELPAECYKTIAAVKG
jgi:phage recombination protein Bet